jgi:hypothetical protein
MRSDIHPINTSSILLDLFIIVKNESLKKVVSSILLCFIIVFNLKAQCTEAKNSEMAHYKRLTLEKDAQGCSQCAYLAMLFCSATYSVTPTDKTKVGSLITATKANIRNMGDPICCPELLSRQPQWGTMANNTSSPTASASSLLGGSYSQGDELVVAVEGLVALGGLIGNDIREARIKKEQEQQVQAERQAKAREIQAKADARKNEVVRSMMKDNLNLANQGNPKALLKVIEGYDQLKDESGKLKFLFNLVNEFENDLARNILMEHYNSILSNFEFWNKYHKKKAVKKAIWSSSLFLLGTVGAAVVLNSTVNTELEEAGDVATSILVYGGLGGGLAVGLSSLGHLAKSGYKRNPHYLNAKTNIYNLKLNKNTGIKIKPEW